MALIECPSCRKRISDKMDQCSHCGFDRKAATSDDVLRKQRLNKFHRVHRIQTESMVAMLIFVGGFAFWKLGDPPADSLQVKGALSAIVIGFIWYIVNRARLILLKRKTDK